jgi:hypothetical protein
MWSIAIGVVAYVAVTVTLWRTVYHWNRHPDASSGTWDKIDRNMAIIAANVSLILLNVVLTVVALVAKRLLG